MAQYESILRVCSQIVKNEKVFPKFRVTECLECERYIKATKNKRISVSRFELASDQCERTIIDVCCELFNKSGRLP